MKKLFLKGEALEEMLPKIYLILALFIGITLSLAMPLFNEPDGQYHYTASTNIARIPNDLSAYGETRIGSGIDAQLLNYQRGNFFEKYFKNTIQPMNMKDLPRTNYIPSARGYSYWGHIIPAIGTRIGYTIYPSLGMLVVFARLFTTLVCSLVMYFIIKRVKAGKLLFFAVSLSPVVTNSFSSLSYDATTYVIAALYIAWIINMIIRERVRHLDLIYLVVLTLVLMFAAKTNLILFAILGPLVMLINFVKQTKNLQVVLLRNRFKESLSTIKRAKKKIMVAIIIIIGLLGVAIVVFRPTLAFSGYRIVLGFMINMNPSLNSSSIFQSLLAAPSPRYNNMPFWVSGIWYVLLVVILLSEKKYVRSTFLALFSVFLFVLGIVAIYYSYISQTVSRDDVGIMKEIGAISGVQGRYFTPTLLVLSIGVGSEKLKVKINSQYFASYFAIVVVILSNALMLFGTLFGIYFLS